MSTYIRQLLEPLTILPSQMAWRDAGEQPPEMRLVIAMFDDAIRTVLQKGHNQRRQEAYAYREAVAWIRSEEREWPFSFINVCELLGLDVEAVRTHTLRRPAAQTDHGLTPGIQPDAGSAAALPAEIASDVAGDFYDICHDRQGAA